MANQSALTSSFATHYESHRSEETLLYAVIEEHYPRFLKRLEAEGTSLPRFVTDEFLEKTQRDVARFLKDDWLLYPSALVTAEETCACYFTVFFPKAVTQIWPYFVSFVPIAGIIRFAGVFSYTGLLK